VNEQTDGSKYWDPYHNDLTIGGVTVAECSREDDAWFLVRTLEEQGVWSAVLLPDTDLDLRGPQVRVAPDDEEKARLILAQPIPSGKREEYELESEIEPEPLPVCPMCGAPDLILQGVDQVNHWRCDACGTKWDQPLSPYDRMPQSRASFAAHIFLRSRAVRQVGFSTNGRGRRRITSECVMKRLVPHQLFTNSCRPKPEYFCVCF
jgi:hypothetical protein